MFAFLLAPDPAESLLAEMRQALASGERTRIEALFADRNDARYLLAAAKRSGPLPSWRAEVFPAPPGWGDPKGFWAIFHTRQPIEQDHDPVYGLVETAQGLRLGKEVPETEEGKDRVLRSRNDVHLLPAQNRAEVIVEQDLDGKGPRRASVLRLQDVYAVEAATVDGTARRVLTADGEHVPHPAPGDVLRVGSLIVPWTAKPVRSMRLAYGGALKSEGPKGLDEDRVEDQAAYLTAWWVPGTARLPFLSQTRITAPEGWEVRSEGVSVDAPAAPTFAPGPDEVLSAYRCDVRISFPKVVAGRYALAASYTDNGRLFRSYQFEPIDRTRAEKDVHLMAEAVRFDEAHLGPWPFPGYDVFDGDGYYGIESYSYTLLAPRITPWATTHEMGHTYFGGLVPCPYVRDSWNEGVTQYTDSVLFLKNADHTLERALGKLSIHDALTDLPIPYEEQGTTYYRGAYVMAMLAHEIGQDAVFAGLRALVADRRGKDTGWPDLRPFFERSSGRRLAWFWDQWVTGTWWPSLAIDSATVVPSGQGYVTRVALAQSGTADPLRLRFVVRLSGGGRTKDEEVTLNAAHRAVEILTEFRPDEASLEVLGYAFASAGPKIAVIPLLSGGEEGPPRDAFRRAPGGEG